MKSNTRGEGERGEGGEGKRFTFIAAGGLGRKEQWKGARKGSNRSASIM